MSETTQASPDAVAGQVDRGVRPHAIRLASQLQSAAYSHGYEDAHPANAITRQDKYCATSQRLLSELREAIELLIAERDALKEDLHNELDGNLRLRDLGGARPDECMTTFLERVFAERDGYAAHAGSIPPKWQKCPTHGAARPNAWGCPECVREMRSELDALRKDVARLVADCVPGGHVCDPQQVADAIRAWFAMTDDAVNTGPASPASDLPQPAAWVRNWTSPQPDCVTSLEYRSAADADRGVEYHPAYTADQMRAATAAMRAQDSAHRSAQAAVYAALGPGADPDRATWPDQIRALREQADVAVRLIADVADIAHAGGLVGMSEHDALFAIRRLSDEASIYLARIPRAE